MLPSWGYPSLRVQIRVLWRNRTSYTHTHMCAHTQIEWLILRNWPKRLWGLASLESAGQVANPSRNREAGLLPLLAISVFCHKALNWLEETHPHYGGSDASKSTASSINYTQKRPSHQPPDWRLTQTVVSHSLTAWTHSNQLSQGT